MKKYKMNMFFTVSNIVLLSLSCSSNTCAQNDYSEVKIISMLKTFYIRYITEDSKKRANKKKLDSLTRKYCTVEFLDSIQKKKSARELYNNPFLKAQMVDELMLKELTVRKDSVKNNLYYVSYKYGQLITFRVVVVKEGEEYKINFIF